MAVRDRVAPWWFGDVGRWDFIPSSALPLKGTLLTVAALHGGSDLLPLSLTLSSLPPISTLDSQLSGRRRRVAAIVAGGQWQRTTTWEADAVGSSFSLSASPSSSPPATVLQL
ncbi:hypothetical protein M9H77_29978 [Catharanthus roseus]|uniref:Uncharacterized protein n=1 Tax=Catharanthus roseus TaxID=4058 RepID=A0ACB9ZWU3_CATRO|nr:hypothetical protein M9H77_29978 [Catharanthus roseus]